MTDDRVITGEPEATRINLNEDYEVRYWTKRFGVDPETLKAAVQRVGTRARDVEAALRK
jgi:hypothetical protein